MKGRFFAAAVIGMAGLLAAVGPARGEDLVTLSGAAYRDVYPLRVEPDGVTWRYEGGAVKVDFADCPEAVRRAYHYDPDKATDYRDAQAKARRQADEQARHDARDHETRQHARAQAAVARMSASDGNATTVIRRALSPAASNATREMAAQMQAEADKRAAAEAANPDSLHLIPALPSALGPRPVNRFMDVPNAREFVATLHRPPGGFAPDCMHDDFFQALYLTRSYYEDTNRAEAFARGVSLKP